MLAWVFLVLFFHVTVKLRLHVQLGVSRLRNTKTALFLARLEKEKPFLPVASAP